MSSFTSRMAAHDSPLQQVFGRLCGRGRVPSEAYLFLLARFRDGWGFVAANQMPDEEVCVLLVEARKLLRQERIHRAACLYTTAVTGDWYGTTYARTDYHAARRVYRALVQLSLERLEAAEQQVRLLRRARRKL